MLSKLKSKLKSGDWLKSFSIKKHSVIFCLLLCSEFGVLYSRMAVLLFDVRRGEFGVSRCESN